MSEAPPDSLERLNEALAGRYRLRREVGEGGMAVVYAADDLRHGRTVAIKVLKADLVDSTGAQRFLREIQVAAKLSHPHILPLLDSGLAGILPFYVMPFVDGDSLAGYLERSGPLSLEETIRITREIARGLAHAHEQGFVHRDIKPDNILFSHGHAVITDFGIAQAIDQAADNRLTKAGSAVGTATYMSPEQWTGAPVDAKSDQYSLACIAYEMLVGAPPFSTTQAVFERHLKGTIPSLRVRRPNTTEEVDATVSRALSNAPGERFATVLAFVEALEHGPVPTSIDRALTSGVVPAERRSRRWITTLAVAGLAVAVGLVGWWLFGGGDVNREAYDRLLLGDAAYDRGSRPDVELALEHYRAAVELDPDYAMGWAKLSRTHSLMNELRFDTSEDRLGAAKQAVDRALALDPELPEAHLALGLYHYWGRDEYEPAVAEFEQASRLRPSDGQVHALIAAVRRRQGRFGEAIQSYQTAADLDPRSAKAWIDLGETLLYTRAYDEARPHLETALQLAPDSPEAYLQLARVALGRSGDLETARTIIREGEERIAPAAWPSPMVDIARIIFDPDLEDYIARMRPRTYGLDSATYLVAKARLLMQTSGRAAAAPQLDSARVLLARLATEQSGQAWIHGLSSTVFAGLNLRDEAVRSAERAMELLPMEADALDAPEFVYALAMAYVMLGRVDEAVACFDHALAVPSWISTYSLGVDPLLEPLHDTPEFRQLVAKWAPTGGATLGSPIGRTSCP